MVRSSAQRGPSKRQVSRTETIPAPTGGLNAVDALAAMPPTDAIVLDNWFPQPSYVALRNGYTLQATGFSTWVETILCYSSAAGEKIFGMSGANVYDATITGAIGAPVVTALSNARWEYTNVATAGGQFLYAGNAADAPLLYDGTAWTKVTAISTPAITGITTTKLRNPIVWKNRVWWVENNSMRTWYLPTASIGGAAQPLDLGPLFRLGGTLQAVLTASLTDGSTFDDYIFFLSSEGELLMYRGTDPAFSATFTLTGIYRIGKPVGRRCWFKYGQDAIIICSDGFVSLTKMISIGRVNDSESISYKILQLVNDSVSSYKSHFGWQGVLYPLGNKILINVPQAENSNQFQFVMNTITNAWCRFTNWNAATFEVQGDNLYFGGSNFIALADVGAADNDAAIPGLMKTAFNYLGSDREKFVKMCRPLIQTDGALTLSLNANMDFADVPPSAQGSYVTSVGSPWDTSPWDTSAWANGLTMQKDWKTIYGVGFTASLYIAVTAVQITVRLQAIDWLYENGGVL